MSRERAKYRGYVTFRLDWVSSIARTEASKIYLRECGLDIRQLRVLRSVAENPGLSVTEIVESTMFERTLVSRIISDLVSEGLLLRRISASDARQFNIDITAQGLSLASTADELGDRLNEELLSSLDMHEREVLDRCLEKLVRWQPKNSEADGPTGNGEIDGLRTTSSTTSKKNKRQSRDERRPASRGANGNV